MVYRVRTIQYFINKIRARLSLAGGVQGQKHTTKRQNTISRFVNIRVRLS